METRSPSSALLYPVFGWEGSPTNIDYSKKGTLILTSPLEDLGKNLTDRQASWSLWKPLRFDPR